ncbi:hypothetical protein D9615_002371 [Tricholomella constricta]|uniref:Clathrin/coatomer adaptor adaptin-like N-terminal domain-containing protein n=1 Tax=Tricholomella constricta TaxID=117010 RepID=A0A8H5M936_9AGAR|nr:hypothetical protein D9615_002371 [Tricholomella constricta]
MEVPFISSGATSRAHYSLVQKVEYATSTQSANQHLASEIEAIRRQLTGPALSIEECRKLLIVLLYCYTNASHGFLSPDAFSFALSHAVTLVEAGRNIDQKRIGYLFCSEVMPAHHELQLMLVNTIRKDLECDNISQICLALDNVIASSNEDLIPAIQSRVHDLLSHNSSDYMAYRPHVRRRALLAFRSLAHHHPELLSRIGRKVVTRLEDPNPSVASAALVLSAHCAKIKKPAPNAQSAVNDALKAALSNPSSYKPWFTVRILSALYFLGLSEDNIPTLLELIRSSSKSHDRAILRGAFMLLTLFSPQVLQSSTPVNFESPVHNLRQFLTSRDPNDVYLFLSCLECIDPILWGGTSPDTPAVLDAWEVEQVMQLLDSSDALIRRTTLRVLNRVDLGIVVAYYSQAIEHIPSGLSINDVNAYALRLIEIVEIQSGEDGELYAHELKELLVRLEKASPDRLVLETVVEMVLNHFRNATGDFRIGFPTTILTSVVESDSKLPQTMMVIVAALATEQCGKLSIPPLHILQGLAFHLPSCILSVKDACLLAMLRVAVECDEIPPLIVQTVTELGQNSKRHIRQRCEQFVTLVHDKAALTEIVRRARTSSLPDFLAALLEQPAGRAPSSPPPVPSSSQILSASKLRYDAYDTPIPAPKLRTRESSRSPYPAGSYRSETLLDSDHDTLSRVNSRLSMSSTDSLSRTMTPGELTLAAGRQELEILGKAQRSSQTLSRLETSVERSIEELGPRVDLIALDSPFVSDPSDTASGTDADDELNFKDVWESTEEGDARGWYNESIDNAVRRLQGSGLRLQVISVDVPPFIGDLKVIVRGVRTRAVLRLKESEEDSCLWRVRCSDTSLRAHVKQLLTEDM